MHVIPREGEWRERGQTGRKRDAGAEREIGRAKKGGHSHRGEEEAGSHPPGGEQVILELESAVDGRVRGPALL